ncbi:fucose-binding lectin II (plasmid) [Embleya sp. NBC_00888]|uniref:fucose-binding lectin II n=1 Tax=Embleya sp. NBC_00888 TaxID=2975960 RepID=UPI002F9187C9|nr:fucose-binding lectin II [Embleya sp. NBC_00888]
MSDAYVLVSGNKAEITLPAGVSVTVKAKTNSRSTQTVKVTGDAGTDLTFGGSGETNTVIGQTTLTGQTKVTALFQYGDGGAAKPSSLNSGGPYAIGSYNLLVIVAENGDDSDYNDAILEFGWYTPKA